jgi:hypothetical protein
MQSFKKLETWTRKKSMIDDIKKLIESSGEESYTKFDILHPLDLYLGLDNKHRKSLAIILNAEREKVSSSKTISVEFFRRNDGETMLCFGLEDDGLSDLFYKFCQDIIESTRDTNPEDGFTSIIERWDTWIKFFSKTALPLSENEILGLIGEIYFLQNVAVEKYGLDVALESYIGTDMAHKDFEVQDTWYEIKAIHNGVRTVKISSIEQLDSNIPGKLEIITFDQSTPSYNGNITLNSIIANFRSILERKWQILFDEKMRKAGYIHDERYDDFNHLFVRREEFYVESDFPKLSKIDLPHGITKASYEIDISSIQRFKV